MNSSIEPFVFGGALVMNEGASVQQAARAMYERRVGSVVVRSEDGKISGIVTDRDLSNCVIALGFSPETVLSEVMSTEIASVHENATIADVVRLMEEANVRRIPVIRRLSGGRERCVGMVSLDDLIAASAIDLVSLSRIVSKQTLAAAVGKKKGRVDVERRQARAEQTLGRFYHVVAEKTNLARPAVEEITQYLLRAIVQRLPASGAAQLISQLPSLLQEDLLDVKAGPNREVSAQSLYTELASRFHMDLERTEAVIEGFWSALEAFTGCSGETGQVLVQLPRPIRSLLSRQSLEFFG